MYDDADTSQAGTALESAQDIRIQLQRFQRHGQHEIAWLQHELLTRRHLDGAHDVLQAGAVAQIDVRVAAVFENVKLVTQPEVYRTATELFGRQIGRNFDFSSFDVALNVCIRQNHARPPDRPSYRSSCAPQSRALTKLYKTRVRSTAVLLHHEYRCIQWLKRRPSESSGR